jgi:hypothetical protein
LNIQPVSLCFEFASSALRGRFEAVRQFKLILSLLCLAIWLPATQHCKLENLPGLAFLQCPTDTPGNSNCEGDSCDVVENGGYKVPDNSDLVLFPMLALVVAEPTRAVADETAVLLHSHALTAALPRLSRESWQYYSVLAVPVRGPSLPS